MDQSACKLTLIVPTTAEEHIFELLLNSVPPIMGFTSWAAEGHGHDFNDATASERVRGRVKRRAIVAVMTRSRADRLLEEIRQKAPIPHIAFWIEPVERFGRLSTIAEALPTVKTQDDHAAIEKGKTRELTA